MLGEAQRPSICNTESNQSYHLPPLPVNQLPGPNRWKPLRNERNTSRTSKNRDDSAFLGNPILASDLVMRQPINRKTKLHPEWDGPFVVYDATSSDAYQLATANGYLLPNLVNVLWLHKLDAAERRRYTDDFWEASDRLRSQDQHALERQEDRDLEQRLQQAMMDQLEAQK